MGVGVGVGLGDSSSGVKVEGQARAGMTTGGVVPEPKARLDKVKPEAKEVTEMHVYCCTRIGCLGRVWGVTCKTIQQVYSHSSSRQAVSIYRLLTHVHYYCSFVVFLFSVSTTMPTSIQERYDLCDIYVYSRVN